MNECSHCDGRGIMTVEDRTHDVLHYEPCYCTLQESRIKEDLERKIANVLSRKVSRERLALVLASVIIDANTDEYAIHQLRTLAEENNAAWLLNWVK